MSDRPVSIAIVCCSHQRKVFGKKLIKQAVIRQKLAKMISLNEAAAAWLENLTYQMTQLDYMTASMHLAG